jgi:hypothetical protein
MWSVTLALLANLAPELAPTTAELTAQIEVVLQSPEPERIAELEQLIGEFEARPLALLASKTLGKRLLRARVVVAWAQQEPTRTAAVDEAIRSAAGSELPLWGLGTEFESLAKQRVAALESGGTATIEVACGVPCEVLVDERRSLNPTNPLLLGEHRVWVVANDGSVKPLRMDVELDIAGETERIEFAPLHPVPPPPEIVLSSQRERDSLTAPAETWTRKQPHSPMLPLWVEIVGVVAGAGLVATGAGVLMMDGNCKGGGDPMFCPNLMETTATGAAITALGSATFVSFTSLLGADRMKFAQHIRAGASVGWGFQF